MARVGFTAECHDCPTLTGDYGETIHNGVMSWTGSVQAKIEVIRWAKRHAVETCHAVTVRRYVTLDVESQHIDPQIWEMLVGG